MPMYTYTYTFQAANDTDASVVADAGITAMGACAEGSANGVTGVREFGGSVAKLTDTNYWV